MEVVAWVWFPVEWHWASPSSPLNPGEMEKTAFMGGRCGLNEVTRARAPGT